MEEDKVGAYGGLSTEQNEMRIKRASNDSAQPYTPSHIYDQSTMDEALFEACFEGKTGFVSTLISLGACVNSRDSQTDTPLIVASVIGHPEIVTALIKAGADVNSRNKYGITSLMEACFWGAKKVVDILIKNGANIHLEDYAGRTALSWACAAGKWDIGVRLINRGAKHSKVRFEALNVWLPYHNGRAIG